MSQYPTRRDEKRRDIQIIHIAKQQLGMDDAAYRAMLWAVARVKSSTELNFVGRHNVIDHLKKCGFKVTAGKNAGKPSPAPAADKSPLAGKIRALLIALDNKPDAYADGMARKMFGVERAWWCTPQQLGKIVAALNYSLARKNKPIPSPLTGGGVACAARTKEEREGRRIAAGNPPASPLRGEREGLGLPKKVGEPE